MNNLLTKLLVLTDALLVSRDCELRVKLSIVSHNSVVPELKQDSEWWD